MERDCFRSSLLFSIKDEVSVAILSIWRPPEFILASIPESRELIRSSIVDCALVRWSDIADDTDVNALEVVCLILSNIPETSFFVVANADLISCEAEPKLRLLRIWLMLYLKQESQRFLSMLFEEYLLLNLSPLGSYFVPRMQLN